MTKTENYQLPQWEASDPLRREDFNDAMEKIDSGLAVEDHVAGYYTGTGVAMADGGQLINVGFKPSFVIISRGWTSSTSTGPYFLAAGLIRVADLANSFTIESNGFRVGSGSTPYLNSSGYSYSYIAFR